MKLSFNVIVLSINLPYDDRGDPVSDFPLYALSEEHQAIREAVRAVCDAKVAPYAADVDEEARYPQEAPTRCWPPTSTPRTCPRSTAAPVPTPWRPSS